jgi:hypothetical protein
VLRDGTRILRALGLVLVVSAGGCGSTKMSNTPRTGTEQLLLTNAWDDALRKVDFRPLTGVPVYFDTQYLTAIDQGWAVSSIRQALLAQGVLLRTKPEQAQWIVEARVGAYGTDDYNLLIGIPQTTMPVAVAGLPTGTIPEIPLAKRTEQQAVAKLALYAYDRASGQVTWNSGTSLATSYAKDVFIGGLGPIQSGSIRGGTEFIGVKLPRISDPGPPSGAVSDADAKFTAPSMPRPASVSDQDSFVP